MYFCKGVKYTKTETICKSRFPSVPLVQIVKVVVDLLTIGKLRGTPTLPKHRCQWPQNTTTTTRTAERTAFHQKNED